MIQYLILLVSVMLSKRLASGRRFKRKHLFLRHSKDVSKAKMKAYELLNFLSNLLITETVLKRFFYFNLCRKLQNGLLIYS